MEAIHAIELELKTNINNNPEKVSYHGVNNIIVKEVLSDRVLVYKLSIDSLIEMVNKEINNSSGVTLIGIQGKSL
jgi:hypothetical protein